MYIKKGYYRQGIILGALVLFLGGCGYTMKATLPEGIKTIAVPTFKNVITPSDRYTYQPGLEIDLTNAVIDDLLFDGNLKVVNEDEADALLLGEIVRYEQESIRYNSSEGVRQYRLFMVVKLTLQNQKTGKVIWTEKNFTGDTEYFIEGGSTVTERTAARNAIEDLAKKIVNRIVEDW
jgi:hypothetical protein